MAHRELVVECARLTRRHVTPSADVLALDSVDVGVGRGSLVAVAGPSGSGKSTLLMLVGCLDRPTSGVVRVEGTDVASLGRRRRRAWRRHRLAWMLPQPSDNLFDHLDGIGNLRWSAQRRGADHHAAGELLERFGIGECADRQVRQMSGGEQQRLALACALVGGPAVVLADEPTASLDRANAATVVAALRAAADHGATVLVATHDADVVAAADDVVWLAHGRRTGATAGGG